MVRARRQYGARQLRLNPGFATVAILSLALGIGANTAIFQLINVLRLQSLPVEAPWELASIDGEGDFHVSGNFSARHRAFTYAQFMELRHRQEAFTELLAFGTTRLNLTPSGEARYAEALYVSGNFLDVLGVRPLFGGGFNGDVDGLDCSGGGAILSHAFWQSEYGGDPAVIGRDVYLNGRMFPVVAVTPPTFFGLEPGRRFDVAVPICADALLSRDGKGRLDRLDAWWLTIVGRLRPGSPDATSPSATTTERHWSQSSTRSSSARSSVKATRWGVRSSWTDGSGTNRVRTRSSGL